MAGGAKVAGRVIVATATLALLMTPVYAQGSKKGGHGAPTTDNKPKVDEKAYKAALDRIPNPKKPFDPWGEVHSSEPPKSANKPN